MHPPQEESKKAGDICYIAWSKFLKGSGLPYMLLCSWHLSDPCCSNILSKVTAKLKGGKKGSPNRVRNSTLCFFKTPLW